MRGESREKENPKAEAWRKEGEEVSRIVDKRGRHVDPGIKEAVLALHLLGLDTDGSCEGHADHGIRAPYLDIGRVPQELADRVKKASEEGTGYNEDLKREVLDTRERILRQLEALMELLGEFYKEREDVPIVRRLVVKITPNGARLYSQSAELQEYYPPEKQSERLEQFREEMDAFKEFLKKKFLSGR